MTPDQVRRRNLITVPILLVILFVVLDAVSAARATPIIERFEAMTDEGLCTAEDPCIIAGLEADVCNIVSGGLLTNFMPLTNRVRNRLPTPAKPQEHCSRSSSNNALIFIVH